MPDTGNIDYHSEPVQEIMGTIPSWITRWGVTVIFAVFTLIVIGCCIIRYPQTVDGGISVTSSCPPSELTARYDGLIDRVCVIDGQKVRPGELIALLSTPARYEDILSLNGYLAMSDTLSLETMSGMRILSENLELGSLQGEWSTLQKSFRDYRHYLETNQTAVKKELVRQQIEGQRSHYATLTRQKSLLDREAGMECSALERDSILFAKKAISQAEYETSLKGFLSKMNTVAGFEAGLEATALGILQLEQQLVELDLQRAAETEEYESDIRRQIYRFKAQAAIWLDTYAIISPSEGIVSLQDYWSPGQHVNVGDVIANITPEGPSEVTGRMKVSSVGFGKVALGQTVNVRLNGFPYMEYGMLKGVVANIAAVPEKMQDGSVAYTVAVDFPDGLESTYRKEFPLIQHMDGEARIITKDRRLIEQFMDPIVSLFRNR